MFTFTLPIIQLDRGMSGYRYGSRICHVNMNLTTACIILATGGLQHCDHVILE